MLPLAGLGLLGLVFSATGSAALLGLALAGLGAELVVHQLAAGGPAAIAIGYGAGLLLLAELVHWATSLPPAARVEIRVVRRRLRSLAATAGVGAAAAALALLGGSVSSGSAVAAVTVGSAGAVGLLAVARLLAAR